MPNCAFGRCNNYTTPTHPTLGISYHAFPKDPFMKHKWVCIVQTERSQYDWKPTKCSKICSEHFKDEDKYITHTASMRLKKTAVPVITPILTIDTEIEKDIGFLEGEDDGILDIPTYVEMKEQDLEDIKASIPIPTYVILKYIDSAVANPSSASCSQTNTAYGSPTRESHIEKSIDVTAITEELESPLSDISIHSDAADSPEEQEIKNKLRNKIKMLNENEEILKRRCEEASILENQHKELLADIKYFQNMFNKKCKSLELNEL